MLPNIRNFRQNCEHRPGLGLLSYHLSPIQTQINIAWGSRVATRKLRVPLIDCGSVFLFQGFKDDDMTDGCAKEKRKKEEKKEKKETKKLKKPVPGPCSKKKPQFDQCPTTLHRCIHAVSCLSSSCSASLRAPRFYAYFYKRKHSTASSIKKHQGLIIYA